MEESLVMITETILIVDDEDSVRRTFQDWLTQSGWNCQVIAVGDAESALAAANQQVIDLAILDWNLGTGSDGLQLLEDLCQFHSEIVAILVTGFAHQATPLQALRMGVRDYLDKNQDLNRDAFLAAVKRQLDFIIPAKRRRQWHDHLQAFREAIEQILPIVQTSATLNDPVPFPEAIQELFQFVQRTTRAMEGVLLVHSHESGSEKFLAYGSNGTCITSKLVPFSQSLAASVISLQEPAILSAEDLKFLGPVQLQPFEIGRQNILLTPMPVGGNVQVVLELFDKETSGGFTEEDRRFARAASGFGSELLKQALAERQTHRVLFNAIDAALHASKSLANPTDEFPTTPQSHAATSTDLLDRLREGFAATSQQVVSADLSVQLAEAIRLLARNHGTAAVTHCLHLVESVGKLLDEINPSSGY